MGYSPRGPKELDTTEHIYPSLLHTACGILVPCLGFKPTPPAWEVQSLNHWTAREVSGPL